MQRQALSISVRRLALPLMLGLLLLTGCQTNRDDRDEARGGPTLVYERARDALDRQDFDNAIRIYEALVARYPFAPEARH
jgi:outer membrane protein assembly factor BamD (BamD/ComL family)